VKCCLFRAEEVAAAREGRKTQYRFPMNPQPRGGKLPAPPLRAGEIVWVKEPWQAWRDTTKGKAWTFQYKADGGKSPIRWRPTVLMPKRAARLWLRVKEVRGQRLQDISEEDARAEGFSPGPEARAAFRQSWDTSRRTHPGYQWAANIWVWAVTFELAEEPDPLAPRPPERMLLTKEQRALIRRYHCGKTKCGRAEFLTEAYAGPAWYAYCTQHPEDGCRFLAFAKAGMSIRFVNRQWMWVRD